MEITITGQGLGVTDRFREYATEKAEKVAHLAEKSIALEIKVCRHHEKTTGPSGDDRVELTLIGPGPIVRAESAGRCLSSAVAGCARCAAIQASIASAISGLTIALN